MKWFYIGLIAVGLNWMGLPTLWANGVPVTTRKFDRDHIKLLSTVSVQDFRGRMKPFHTLANEVLRKLTRKTSLYGMDPVEVVINMSLYPEAWHDVPLIRLGKHPKIRELVGVEGKLASYDDFFDADGKFKLLEELRAAHAKERQYRGTFENELIRLDERINIVNMIFHHRLMRLFPLEGDPGKRWITGDEASRMADTTSKKSIQFAAMFFPVYRKLVDHALSSGDWSLPNQAIQELKAFQAKYGGDILPTATQTKAEILLNKSNIFDRLMRYYGVLGIFALVLFFIRVFRPQTSLKIPRLILLSLVWLAFALHVFGLAVRWYVSERAPWSNAYESLIYIAFTGVLAGILFGRKSLGALAASLILGSTFLMVAHLNNFDPEITPLVPVLKSYWLTIHVSLMAGSYGFLLLGAVIGLINLVLFGLMTRANKSAILSHVKKLTNVSEMTIMAGLVMASIGCYLGGVWANESWGRYWGWDPKETWALVTILVYAFIVHMRYIPGVRGLYAFNVATLFGFATVMMTYFGVNFYLSGLHSYAAGDPVPMPPSVYITALVFLTISFWAYWKYRAIVQNKA